MGAANGEGLGGRRRATGEQRAAQREGGAAALFRPDLAAAERSRAIAGKRRTAKLPGRREGDGTGRSAVMRGLAGELAAAGGVDDGPVAGPGGGGSGFEGR